LRAALEACFSAVAPCDGGTSPRREYHPMYQSKDKISPTYSDGEKQKTPANAGVFEVKIE
jgi:hypothetical protein